MKPQKLLVVTRNFWPHAGLTELAMSDLVLNLADAGCRLTVATFKQSKGWSDQVFFQQIPVVRFSRPVTGPWTSYRYARTLSRHFQSNDYDAILVSGCGEDALAVTRSVGEYTPVFLMMDDGYVGVTDKLHRKHIETFLSADRIIANSQATAAQLYRLEEMPPVQVIEPGIRRSPAEIFFDRPQIRAALSKSHPVTRTDANQPLVICATRMDSLNGFVALIEAWPTVLSKFPGAKLWLLGEGSASPSIWQMILEKDLAYSVLLPGYFDDLDEVFKAADLYVDVGGPELSGEGLIRAMSAGLAPVAFRHPVTKELIHDGIHGRLVFSGSPKYLADGLVDCLNDEDWRKSAGQNASEMIVDRFAPLDQAEQYMDLIASFSDQLVEVAK